MAHQIPDLISLLGTVIPIGRYCPTNNTIQANPYKNRVSGYPLDIYVVTNFRKKIRTITGGPWWTQIKVALIQKGLLDNQNPGFCMGWPGLYLMDRIEHSRTVCFGGSELVSFLAKTEHTPKILLYFVNRINADLQSRQKLNIF